jgi:small subunit ribosomal protein S27Ae
MAEKAKGKGKPAEKAAQKPTAEKPAQKPTGKLPAAEKPTAAPAAVEKPEEKPTPEKAVKEKKLKVKKKEKGAYTRYKVDEKGLTRLRPYCERCGQGYFMADHGNRYSCGHCGFTRYKQA